MFDNSNYAFSFTKLITDDFDFIYEHNEIPTTILTNNYKTDNIIETKDNYSGNIKCKTSSFESSIYNLCLLCNILSENLYF